MTKTETKHTCVAIPWRGDYYDKSPCGKTARYPDNGKWYCKTHHPPSVKARQAKRDKAWREERDRIALIRYGNTALRAAKERVAEAALKIAVTHVANLTYWEFHDDEYATEFLASVEALRKLKGEG